MRTLRNGLPAVCLLLGACAMGPSMDRPGYERDEGGYPQETRKRPTGYTETGMISYYADKFDGKKTASGAIFRKDGFTAAHRSLPFHTKIKVTNISNGRSVIVEVTDRGPFAHDRILDLSPAAARQIGILGKGTAKATLTVL